ncbi:LysR substrate-binding domain-containing protein [Sinorhizobium meliloti]|jgi:DNA-binding transcriptional LysR family regulator|uniref:LysR family transcriptional regulator n=1 Tax=Sinorhizobium TaxID=28105 RepID=UPI0023D82B8E|nr:MULTISPECIES: LysR family transcriptional regulator [Sinorhizobium]GCA50426.1 HTH-type transcriptional regulator DmlR [Sinorhizobium sp. KGO-5]WEJ13201.1 LysR substrate-binding domain-containing protein [Sinorhizobium sp. M103]WEJ18288.1 LysR substrate-binding domain-containing protein [Sinorhizobium sp. K101]WEJ39765.1 LysR substrate-binding domain-containing protein [Sinorhizobium sp. C101]WRQ69685.1 LysR substrate-binding domain-containing protein [Sinorhizobium meliloti]
MEQASLKELEAAVAIARRGTFRAASIDLGISTTALSHTIGRLESALGVRLFNRTTRSVSLTDAGRLFIQHVAPSLQDLHAALETVREQRETPSGTIRINAAPFAARAIISPLVLEFVRRYPDMNVDIVTEGRMIDIVRDGFDLGVRVAGLVPSDMIAVSLGRPQRHAVVGSPAYFERHCVPVVPPDLLTHKCIRVRLPDGSTYRWRFEKDGEQVQIDVEGQISLDEASLTRAAVLAGAGIGYLFEQDILPEIKTGRVIRVLEDWTPPYPGLCLYYPGRRNLSAGVRAFLELARELARRDSD